jgi:hypothetical protein
MSKEYLSKIGFGTVLPISGNLMAYVPGDDLTCIDKFLKAGGQATLTLDSNITVRGGKSMLLEAGLTVAPNIDYVGFTTPMRHAGGNIIKANIRFRRDATQINDSLGFGFGRWVAGVWAWTSFIYNQALLTCYLTDASQTPVAVTLNMKPSDVGLWHEIEIKYNLKTGEYLHIAIDGAITKTPGYGGELVITPGYACPMVAYFEMDALAAGLVKTYVNDLIVVCD